MGKGPAAPSSPRSWQPRPTVLGPTLPAHLAEHLVPIENRLPLLLHLQLPALLRALHALQHGVRSGAPQRASGGCHRASVLQGDGKGDRFSTVSQGGSRKPDPEKTPLEQSQRLSSPQTGRLDLLDGWGLPEGLALSSVGPCPVHQASCSLGVWRTCGAGPGKGGALGGV